MMTLIGPATNTSLYLRIYMYICMPPKMPIEGSDSVKIFSAEPSVCVCQAYVCTCMGVQRHCYG